MITARIKLIKKKLPNSIKHIKIGNCNDSISSVHEVVEYCCPVVKCKNLENTNQRLKEVVEIRNTILDICICSKVLNVIRVNFVGKPISTIPFRAFVTEKAFV